MGRNFYDVASPPPERKGRTMPESVPPKEIAKAVDVKSAQSTQGQGVSETEQVPGQAREPIKGDTPAAGPAAPAAPPAPARPVAPAGPAAPAAPAAPKNPDAKPGDNFRRIRWVNKIGGHEADEEWAEERRAQGLVASGHAELVEDKGK
jgi:hypothetical protein